MKKYAVIVAGGSGRRMNTELPKQFLLVNNRPVLFYTLDVFLKSYPDLQIILVLPEGYIIEGQKIVDEYFTGKRILLIAGGDTRFHSVQNGLGLITDESIVFVHDGVRCLLTTALIHRCYEAAIEFGSAIPVINSKDSIRIVNGDESEAVERSNVKQVQTPQTFHSRILLPAFTNIEYKSKFTDEATVVEEFGLKVNLVEGENDNIKITTPIDLMIAEKMLEERLTKAKNP